MLLFAIGALQIRLLFATTLNSFSMIRFVLGLNWPGTLERLDEDKIHMQGLLLLLVRLPVQFAFTVEFRATAWHNVTENNETPIAQSSVHNKGRSLPLIPRASFVKFCLWGC